jgi:hypothetical protein
MYFEDRQRIQDSCEAIFRGFWPIGRLSDSCLALEAEISRLPN